MSWPGIKKIIILKCRLHLFYTTTTNHFSIGLWYVIERGFHDDQLSDRTERSSKVLPKAKFVPPKKGHGHCLVVCCWSDPLQLPESWQNHYIWEVYSANQGDALKTAMPAAGTGHQMWPILHNNIWPHITQPTLHKLNELGYKVLRHPPFHLTSHQPTTTSLSILTTFLQGKCFHNHQEAENSFPRVHQIPKQIFMLQEYTNLFLTGKNVLTIMVPVLINKDVFEPSYNDLKFMVQNFNYVCTKLISSVIYNCHNLLSFALLVPTLSNSIPSLPSEWSSSSTSLLEILLLLPSA